MGGRTERYNLTSGFQSAASGLATAFSVDSQGELRHLSVQNDGTSGTVTIAIYVDSGLLVYGNAVLNANASVPDVDCIGSALLGSGTVLVSGSSVTNQAVGFTQNLTIQYMKSSGTLSLTAIVDINKSIMPS